MNRNVPPLLTLAVVFAMIAPGCTGSQPASDVDHRDRPSDMGRGGYPKDMGRGGYPKDMVRGGYRQKHSMESAYPHRSPREPWGSRVPLRPVTRELDHEGFHVTLNLRRQVLALSIAEDQDPRAGIASEPVLRPSPFEADDPSGFVSGSMLLQKAKLFDDGLLAAVELAAQSGHGELGSKREMLATVSRGLLDRLGPEPVEGNVPDVILAACRLGGVPIEVPGAYADRVAAEVGRFLDDATRSRPLGIYDWSDDLRAIFQQDRQLQAELIGHDGVDALARTLHEESSARATYVRYLDMIEGLTNPLDDADLRPALEAIDQGSFGAPAQGAVFFPSSRSRESDLIHRLFDDRPIPEDFDLATELTYALQARSIFLEPSAVSSGWYDYLTWSLGPLVNPTDTIESKHLALDESYTDQLLELFKGAMALTRETHVKQLEVPVSPAAAPRPEVVVIPIRPELTVEPLKTSYYRRAVSYLFVRLLLEESFGAGALGQLRRWTEDGPVDADLATELETMIALFYGASEVAGRELGIRDPSTLRDRDPDADAATFLAWADAVSADPDLARDTRMMVPVFHDARRQQTKVWAVLGWTDRPLVIDFAEKPNADVTREGRNANPESYQLEFDGTTRRVAYPVTVELYVDEPLDREAFQTLCDRHKTQSAILEALGVGPD